MKSPDFTISEKIIQNMKAAIMIFIMAAFV